jgi:hypothetical protein
MYRDVLTVPNQGIVYDSGWQSNAIVDRCKILLAAFVGNLTPVEGIQYLALGRGDDAWDKNGPGTVNPAIIGLVDQIPTKIRKEDLQFTYLNKNDQPVAGPEPTVKLQISGTLGPGQPPLPDDQQVYHLREFGLFANFNGVDYMINCVRHPVIFKEPNATLERTVRLYF